LGIEQYAQIKRSPCKNRTRMISFGVTRYKYTALSDLKVYKITTQGWQNQTLRSCTTVF